MQERSILPDQYDPFDPAEFAAIKRDYEMRHEPSPNTPPKINNMVTAYEYACNQLLIKK